MKKFLLSVAAGIGVTLVFETAALASLSTYYSSIGQRLPSLATRTQIAAQYGITPYSGTLAQNLLLEKFLRSSNGAIGAGYTPVTGYQSRTTQYISATATTIPVASTQDKAGNQITLSNISPSSTVKVYFNLEPGTSNEEPIVCTGVTVNSWTGCTRGLSFQGSSETSSTTLEKTHNAGAPIVITNIGQFYNQYVSVDGAQTINGLKTLNNTNLVFGPGNNSNNIYFYFNKTGTTSTDPFVFWNGTKMGWSDDGSNTFTFAAGSSGLTAGNGITINNSAIGFNPAATSTGALGFYGNQVIVTTSTGGGITILSDGLAVNTSTNFTFSGSNTFSSTTNFTASSSLYRFVDDKGTANAYVVNPTPSIGTYAYGTQIIFKAAATSTAASTINVNGLGTKTIKLYNQDLGYADIRGGQIVKVIYDGTNFQLISRIGGDFSLGFMPRPSTGITATTSIPVSSPTKELLSSVDVPYDMIVNKIGINLTANATPGNLTFGIFSQDGQTNVVSSTFIVSAGTGVKTLTLASPVHLSPGAYYVALTSVGTTNITISTWNGDVGPIVGFTTGGVTGSPVAEGNLTVNAGTLSTTFTPSSITYETNDAPIVYFGN